MTLPTFVAVGTQASGGNGATISPGLPSGWAADDIHVLWVETPDFDVASGPGAGWTAMPNSPKDFDTATFVQLTAWWRRAVAGDTAPSITAHASGNHILAAIFGIRGCVTTGNPWNVTTHGTFASSGTPQWTSGSHTTAPGPHLTTTVADCLIALITVAEDDTTGGLYSAIANSSLANVTERFDTTISTGNGGNLFLATGEKATAGDTGAWSATKALPRGAGCYFVVAFTSGAAPQDGYWEVLLDEQ